MASTLIPEKSHFLERPDPRRRRLFSLRDLARCHGLGLRLSGPPLAGSWRVPRPPVALCRSFVAGWVRTEVVGGGW